MQPRTILPSVWLGPVLIGLWGCAGAVQAQVEMIPPPAGPQPVVATEGGAATGSAKEADRCPDEEEDGLPPDPEDGCPTTDPDGDGVAGSADQCPGEGETKNDYRDEDGCPDEEPEVHFAKDEIRLRDKTLEFTGAFLSPAAAARVGDIAAVLKEHGDVELLEIGVHTAGNVAEPASTALAAARSKAIIAALLRAGIPASRLRAKGYGGSCKLEEGRVDLIVLRRAGKDTGAPLGCARANR